MAGRLLMQLSVGQSIRIGDVMVTLLGTHIREGRMVARLGFVAPKDIEIHREEVWLRLQQDKEAEKQS